MKYITLINHYEGVHHGINIFPVRHTDKLKSLLHEFVESKNNNSTIYNNIKKKLIGIYND